MIPKRKKIKRGSWQTIFSSILFGILILGSIFFLLVSNSRIEQKRKELKAQSEILKEEIRLSEEKIKELKANISQAGKETYWEEKVREQGYKRPGEEQVVIFPPAKVEAKETENEKNFWQEILDPLRNLFFKD